MKKLVFFGGQFYRFSFNLFVSFCGRLFWYIRMVLNGPKSWSETTKKIKETIKYIDEFEDVKTVYKEFQWLRDGLFDCECVFNRWPTWRSTIRIMFFRGLVGNCDDAEILTRWIMSNYKEKPFEYQENIYLPIKPKYWPRTHYFSSIKHDGILYQFSSGLISIETAESLANRYLDGIKYVWLKGGPGARS